MTDPVTIQTQLWTSQTAVFVLILGKKNKSKKIHFITIIVEKKSKKNFQQKLVMFK